MWKRKKLRVPYAFYNDSFGTAVGFVYGITGYPQKQSMLLGTAMAGTEGSVMGFLMGRDLRLPFSDRLFVDLVAQVGRFKEIKSYSDGNPDFPDERVEATVLMKITILKAMVGTTTFSSDSTMFCQLVTGRTKS